MNMELRSTGASFVAGIGEKDNPRDLVVEVIEKNPQADRKARFEKFRALLQDAGDGFQCAVEWYFFVNMHDYMTSKRTNPHRREECAASPQRAAARRATVESIKAQIMHLDLTMPNGKSMRDCTGAEMAKFGNRYQRIAEKVGKAKTVGAVLNEAQVKAIMK